MNTDTLPIPEWMNEMSFLGLQLWQWIGFLLLILAAWALSLILAGLLQTILKPVVRRTASEADDRIVRSAKAPLRLALGVAIFAAGSAFLSLPAATYFFLGSVERALLVVAAAWLVLRLVDIGAEVVRERLEASGRRAAIAAVPLGSRAVKVFMAGIALIALLQNVGFNVGGLIAGLGVGGLAVALAAQKSIANLFGGVSLIADQPVSVGDFCRYGDGKMGTVEEVGLRSTRIRTLDRTLVTIPNAEFSEIQLENFGARERIRLFSIIGLRYETSPDQLRHVLTGIRKLLLAHPRVTEAPARARFVGFGAHSLDIEIFAYVDTSDFNEFLKIREDIFLRMMDVVAASGTGFAFPSQTLYLGRDSGMDVERTRAAEAAVEGWRSRNELPFPDFPEALAGKLENSADWPPAGSSAQASTG